MNGGGLRALVRDRVRGLGREHLAAAIAAAAQGLRPPESDYVARVTRATSGKDRLARSCWLIARDYQVAGEAVAGYFAEGRGEYPAARAEALLGHLQVTERCYNDCYLECAAAREVAVDVTAALDEYRRRRERGEMPPLNLVRGEASDALEALAALSTDFHGQGLRALAILGGILTDAPTWP